MKDMTENNQEYPIEEKYTPPEKVSPTGEYIVFAESDPKRKKCELPNVKTEEYLSECKEEYVSPPEEPDEFKNDDDITLAKRTEEVVTPLAQMPYEEQLEFKQEKARKAIRDLGRNMFELNPRLRKYVSFQTALNGGLVCPVDTIIPSPYIDHYRNKCEFSIGKRGDRTVVGFAVGSGKSNKIEIGPVADLRHINRRMKKAVVYFEEYLQTSPYQPFSPVTHSGVWRQMAVRTTNTGDFIIIITIHPQFTSRKILDNIKSELVDFFRAKKHSDKAFNMTAIYFQELGQLVSGEKVLLQQVYGSVDYIEERICGKTFRASPDSFFQVNTAACAKLYEKIGELAEVDSSTAVLDICCGVGTIGISIAQDAARLSGVDFIEGAIEHARFNAKMNYYSTAKEALGNSEMDNNPNSGRRYYHGKAEDYVPKMLRENNDYKPLAILDSLTAGIGTSVIASLRADDRLDKIIYVSYDSHQALGNFRALVESRTKYLKGDCFIPVRAIPVDLFPHTVHLELIILFEKYGEAKCNMISSGRVPAVIEPLNKGNSSSTEEANGGTKDLAKQLSQSTCRKRKRENEIVKPQKAVRLLINKNPVELLNELKKGLVYQIEYKNKQCLCAIEIDHRFYEGIARTKKIAKITAAREVLSDLYGYQFDIPTISNKVDIGTKVTKKQSKAALKDKLSNFISPVQTRCTQSSSSVNLPQSQDNDRNIKNTSTNRRQTCAFGGPNIDRKSDVGSSRRLCSVKANEPSPVTSSTKRKTSSVNSSKRRGTSPVTSSKKRGTSPVTSSRKRGTSPMTSAKKRGTSPVTSSTRRKRESPEKTCPTTDNLESVIFGKSIGMQLHKLSETQRIIAEKLMSDIMFCGKLGKLTEDCSFEMPKTCSVPSK